MRHSTTRKPSAARVALFVLLPLSFALMETGAAQTQPYRTPYPQQPVAIDPPPPRPFAKGASMGSLSIGFASYNNDTVFTTGLSYGYFFIDGLALGLSTRVDVASNSPNRLELSPFLRFIPITFQNISPVFIAKGGRIFIQDFDDLWTLGGGGGLMIMTSQRIGFSGEVVYERFFPETVCTPVCSRVIFSGGVGLLF